MAAEYGPEGEPPPDRSPARKELLWSIVRFSLGQAQMIGAVVAAYLVLSTGFNKVSVAAFLITCLFTLVSKLLFRDSDHTDRREP